VPWARREGHSQPGPTARSRARRAQGDGPKAAGPALDLLAGQLRDLEERIGIATARITATQKTDPLARRLATIPGLGPIASSAFAATTPDVAVFRSARDLFVGDGFARPALKSSTGGFAAGADRSELPRTVS